MPPHCDTRDGPVVKAAKKALETRNLNYVLIWIPEESEKELKDVFTRTLRARKAGRDAQDVADDWFFETAIRLHRAGEAAPYTGMKPAGDMGVDQIRFHVSLHDCSFFRNVCLWHLSYTSFD